MDTELHVSETIEPKDETNTPQDAQQEPAGETIPGTEETMAGEPAAGEQVSAKTVDGIDLQAIAAAHEPKPMDPDDPNIEIEYGERYLQRAMTDEERMTIGQEMADAIAEAESLEARKKEIDSDLKTSIDYQYEKAGKLAKSLREGTRAGNVQVRIVKDWNSGSIVVNRTDTQEELEHRAMTYDERQRTLLNGDQTGDAVTTSDAAGDGFQNNPRIVEPEGMTVQTETIEDEIAASETGDPAEALAAVAGGQVGNA